MGQRKEIFESGHMAEKEVRLTRLQLLSDTVGDHSGYIWSIQVNILIKLMTIVSLVFAPVFIHFGGILFG